LGTKIGAQLSFADITPQASREEKGVNHFFLSGFFSRLE
jgi:hypothetical protein